MLLLPFFGGVEIDERERNLFFGSAAFGADVVDDVADDAVAHDDLVAAVLHDEAGAMGCGGLGIGGQRFLLGGGEAWGRRKTKSGKD